MQDLSFLIGFFLFKYLKKSIVLVQNQKIKVVLYGDV